ncbi:MAG: DUF1684 domain-containing protein [Cryomorphaceae bacterium]|nr:DUF1684 domain-containing protein [Cryomorphaceae bacterium]
MIKLLYAILFLTYATALSAQLNYVETIEHERDSIVHHFGSEETSILKEEDRDRFRGMPFFPISEDWLINASFERIEKGKEFKMKTSTDRLPVYRPYGKAKFVVDGVDCELTIYQNVELCKKEGYEDYLFIPFTDATNAVDSYGGGRYVDLRIKDVNDGKVAIDFNRCYNPYCAYNDSYSCPIPPRENDLKVRIEAGVKKSDLAGAH